MSRRSRSIIIIQLFLNLPFIGSLQIYKAGDPTSFELGDNSAGFFKTTNVGVRGHSIVRPNMLRCTKKQLGIQ